MNAITEDILMHYGTKRHSGRYPWGSGDSPYQHSGDFISRVKELKSQGLSQLEIAKAMGMSTTDLRMQLRVANHERRSLLVDRAKSLREDGKSLQEIADIMGYKNDSSVRSLLNEDTAANKNKAKATADILKKELEEKGMIDVGIGAERELGISQTTLKEALFILETQGYNVYGIGIPQVTNVGKQTNTPVLTKPDVEYKDVYQNMGEIKSVGEYHSVDGGTNWNSREYPSSIDSKRIYIRYGDDGGSQKDGVVELRRDVDDLSLGNSHYAQVRILTDGTHYLKGMAMYSDDIPDGYDVVFNTNKKSDTSKMDVFKKIKDDPDNPFGAYIKADGQSFYIDTDGIKKLSSINKLKEEGDWDSMSKNLSSQFLSKQPIQLIKKQLNLTYSDAEAEFDEILSLTNPTVKKKMLLDFADECDGAVVHLQAAALPRQKTQVILPITALKENEVYAPNFKNGESVALVRFPHGGTFEIPVLTVNNKNSSAKNILGNVLDAIGIHPKVAERLSGADFDGDQAVVIPLSDKVRIKSTPALKALEGFNAKDLYPEHSGMKYMTKANTQKQMGVVSNLITDMTLRGASESEIARAVKHSMVVIDAEKHKLDYKQSEKDNGIAELKKKYQGYTTSDGKTVGGASTLLSRRKQDLIVPERQGSGTIDPISGKVSYKQSGRTYTDPKTGKTIHATTKSKLLLETSDIRSLSSGTPQENAYADYANKMKSLANEARKEYKSTGKITYSSSAKATYQGEVDALMAKLNVALKNAPRERQAQAIANSVIKAKTHDNPELSKDKKEKRKVSQQAIYDARNAVGASGKNTRITISDREWEAIQAGAITDNQLSQILRYADPDAVKQRATPRTTSQLSTAKVNKIKSMVASGYNNSEIAESIGVSTSTVSKYLN
ncbi:hypothetical protein FACS1894132_04950 [Clostridia bacterium]|nr:hypothetical protein FACS1894132_04950 [Clostridia bacterium]